jgi:hypothetical protein
LISVTEFSWFFFVIPAEAGIQFFSHGFQIKLVLSHAGRGNPVIQAMASLYNDNYQGAIKNFLAKGFD